MTPARSRADVERAAYLKLVQGKLTARQYLEAIAPPRATRRRGRASRRRR